MRIAFLGLPLAALLLLEDGHDVRLACVSRADGVGLRRLKKKLGDDRVLLKPRLDEALFERIGKERPDLVVSWYWTNRIPMELVKRAPMGGFGVHPSLLPRHRGPDPTTWAILRGDEETGVTAHRLESDYDTGAILTQERLRIDPSWDSFTLARALDRPSLRVLRDVARAFSQGEPPPEIAQDASEATSAPFPEDEDLIIRWGRPTNETLRQIRAFGPFPGASTEVNGSFVSIQRAQEAPVPKALEEPSESVVIEGRVIIRTLDGALEVLRADVNGLEATLDELAELFESRAS
jgi:methionyl-tRNA formyltransferase